MPNISVKNSNNEDITVAKVANYQISYAVNATNESNYSSANYQSFLPNATMIKIINT
jgi:hypothetical protein